MNRYTRPITQALKILVIFGWPGSIISNPPQPNLFCSAVGAQMHTLTTRGPRIVVVNRGGTEGAVTGPDRYPLQTVLTNLGINRGSKLAGLRIASIGEGYSELLPYLLSQGANAVGIDLWYNQATPIPDGEQRASMQLYRQTHAPHLVEGSATDIPLPDLSQDLILSHQLVNNLDDASVEMLLSESFRVLKVGGVAVHYGFSLPRVQAKGARDPISHFHDKFVMLGLTDIRFEPVTMPNPTPENPQQTMTVYRLSFRKLKQPSADPQEWLFQP